MKTPSIPSNTPELKRLSGRGFNTVGGRTGGGRNLKPGGTRNAGGATIMPRGPGAPKSGPLPKPSSTRKKRG
jgi:hypothetical protein